MTTAGQSSYQEVVWNGVDLQRLSEFASELVRVADSNLCIGLIGTLGAGKTRLVQEIAQCIGVDRNEVTSPTFTLVQHYQGNRPNHSNDAASKVAKNDHGKVDTHHIQPGRDSQLRQTLAATKNTAEGSLRLHHVDAYRIQDEDEWFEAGMEELLHEVQQGNIQPNSLLHRSANSSERHSALDTSPPHNPSSQWVLIEWANRFESLLPNSTLWIELTHSSISHEGSAATPTQPAVPNATPHPSAHETVVEDSYRQITLRSASPANAGLLRHFHDHPAAQH